MMGGKEVTEQEKKEMRVKPCLGITKYIKIQQMSSSFQATTCLLFSSNGCSHLLSLPIYFQQDSDSYQRMQDDTLIQFIGNGGNGEGFTFTL